MQGAPVDGLPTRPARGATQPEPAQECRGSDVDGDEPKPTGVLRELDVAYAADAFSCEVDDLRVQHVPVEEETVPDGGRGLDGAQARPRVERLDVGPRVPPAVRDQVRDHRVLLIERRREVPDAPDPLSLRADEGRPKEVGEEARPRRHQVLVCWRTSGTVTRTRASTATQPSGATSTGFRSSSATSGRSSPSARESVQEVDHGIGVGGWLAAVAANERARLAVEHELVARRRP